ncbi:hypothetical protein [Gramella sp. AN32]|uniref:Restriction endonuclease n=1 Tax=Christiangramia antarctica TaxID=2058158 RepID=A0ABW5X9N9_9FLAO|nr:hypothetical protein [Gramella sp. AN32]
MHSIKQHIEQVDLSSFKLNYILEDHEFDANRDQKILEITGSKYDEIDIKTFNIVGSFFYKNHQLNINCRFGNSFLEYMIANTSGFIELENLGGVSKDVGFGEWILILYWKMQIKKAFAMGLYKTYKKRSEELSTIRGSIDINAYIKKQYFDGKTQCAFNEHSYDNHLNYTIQKAFKKIARSKSNFLLKDIQEIKRTFDNLYFSRTSQTTLSTKVSNPFYHKYNEVYELSRKIINDEFLSFRNPDSEFSAFVFDISLLFEHHIRKILKGRFELAEKNKTEFKVPNGISENHLFPDVVIEHTEKEISLFDVKYKRFYTEGNFAGVLREDRFQLISYLAYYSSRYNIRKCGFIYSCDEEDYDKLVNSINRNQSIKVGEKEISFEVHFYKVSKDLNLQRDFDKKFQRNFDLKMKICA